MHAGGKSIFKVGKMIGIHKNTNHGLHGGPIHHVFPTTYRGSPATYDDDDDHRGPPQPLDHKAVVDAHYGEGTHYHYSHWSYNLK